MPRKKPEAAPEAPAAETPAVVAVAASVVEPIALSRLVRAPENVRHIDSDTDIDLLADDIAGHGILQSLIGYERNDAGEIAERNQLAKDGFRWRDPEEAGPAPLIFIVGGGRRLGGLERLQQRGAIDGGYQVPVQIRPRDQAIELSLAENVARRNMSPVDEFRAFKALIDLHPGTIGVTDLAQRFGYTVDFVRQRMRLADLHEDILAAVADKKITLDAAYAYASTQDTEVQLRVFRAQEKNTWQPHSPGTIRSEITGAIYFEHEPIVRYLGLEPYEAAGGQYEDSLFVQAGDHRRLSNTAIVDKLARDKAGEELPALLTRLEGKVAQLVLAPRLRMSGYNPAKPKAPKGTVWISASYSGAEKWKKAQAANAEVTGIAFVNPKGALDLYGDGFFVPKALKDQIDPPHQHGGGYVPPTPEEEEQRRRERTIFVDTARRALPFTPEQRARVRFSDWGRMVQPGNVKELGAGFLVEMTFFVTEAEAAEQAPAAAAAYEALKAEEQDRLEARETLRTSLVAAPPAVLTDGPHDPDSDMPLFLFPDGKYRNERPDQPGGADRWAYDDVGTAFDQLDKDAPIEHWPTLADYDAWVATRPPTPGRCRICKCEEEDACELEDEDGKYRTCGWADDTGTLCDNPDCVAAVASDTGSEPMAEAAE